MSWGGEGLDEGARLALLDRLPEVVVALDGDARVRWMNRTGLVQLGFEPSDVAGLSVFDVIHPDDLGYMLSSWEKRAGNPAEPGLIVQCRCRRGDGSWWVGEVVGLSLLEDPEVGAMVITARDLSHQAALADSPARLRSMVDRTTDVLFLLDREGRFVYANRRITALLGHDSDRLVGTSWTDLVAVDDVATALDWFNRLADGGDGATSRLNLRLQGVGGRSLAADLHGTNQLSDPLIAGVIVSARDVEDVLAMQEALEERNAQLSHLATHDALTGLLNRGAFVDGLQRSILERRERAGPGEEVVVMFCDLDGFKPVNDRHGHHVGDEVLREVARRLLAEAREDDLVARYGGDEFTVLLAGHETPAAMNAIVARLRADLERPIAVGDAVVRVSASVGVSRAPVADAEVDALLSAADSAMYHGKRARHGEDPRDCA